MKCKCGKNPNPNSFYGAYCDTCADTIGARERFEQKLVEIGLKGPFERSLRGDYLNDYIQARYEGFIAGIESMNKGVR